MTEKKMIRLDWFDSLYQTLHKWCFGETNWELCVKKKNVQVTQRKSLYDRKKNFRWPKKDSGGWKATKEIVNVTEQNVPVTEENRSEDWKEQKFRWLKGRSGWTGCSVTLAWQ